MMLHVAFEQDTLSYANLPYHTDNVYFEREKGVLGPVHLELGDPMPDRWGNMWRVTPPNM